MNIVCLFKSVTFEFMIVSSDECAKNVVKSRLSRRLIEKGSNQIVFQYECFNLKKKNAFFKNFTSHTIFTISNWPYFFHLHASKIIECKFNSSVVHLFVIMKKKRSKLYGCKAYHDVQAIKWIRCSRLIPLIPLGIFKTVMLADDKNYIDCNLMTGYNYYYDCNY